MKELSACPEADAIYAEAAPFRGAIFDRRTKQRLEVVSDEPFALFTLDDHSVEWDGKRPDGVLVADVDGTTFVCFLELKGRADLDRAFLQLESGAHHFCPAARTGGSRTHGDEHHDAWGAGLDPLHPLPGADHRTLGVFVTFRAPERRAPRPPVLIAGKPYVTQVVYLSKKKPHWAQITPRDLLKSAGII